MSRTLAAIDIQRKKIETRSKIKALQAQIKAATFKVPRRVIDGPLRESQAWKNAAIAALARPSVNRAPGDSLTLPELRGRLQKLATVYQTLI